MNLLIRNGLIVDGSGNPPFQGYCLVKDGLIHGIWHGFGPSTLPVKQKTETIDAMGRIVCPGFVDIHRHCDTAALREDFGMIELSQGITSCIAGNCGMSPVPNVPETRQALQNYLSPCLGSFADETFSTHTEYLSRLESKPLPLNVGFYAGMGAIRIAVKGFDKSPFTKAEMDAARGLLQEALDCGAYGLSIGLMYVPELYSSADEIAALASVMKGGKGILCAHMRSESGLLGKAVQEVTNIAKKAEVPLEISHFKAAGMAAWHETLHRAIEFIEAERACGTDITVDFYPYDCGSSTMMQMLPPAYLAVGLDKAIDGLKNPKNVARMRKLLSEGEPGWDNLSRTIGWDRTIISSVNLEENLKFTGKSVSDCTREYGYRDEAEMVAALMYSEKGVVGIINQSMSIKDIDTIARLPYSSLISDALYGGKNNPHPRLYGAFPRFLQNFVRERNVLDIATAIRKMTWQPARKIGLTDRGILLPGCKADILIFDPSNFKDNADYINPSRLSSGLDYVIVNGKTVYSDGKLLCRNASVLHR
ncbi:MAG: amidohydrolase family protein [Spirochaetaceae bacterium]|jgi:N-acyl-D-amino-acid deacylase|nr:amidohydrolase family protein [Spirochaetaceae bacterium]